MNNEPVAWMSIEFDEDGDKLTMLSTYNDPLNTKQIPLYTHPAKTLTDEEITELWKPLPDTKTYDSDILKFARAILKKASEK